jgi:tetratricopeptide (TPR) repeat protein
MSNLGLCYRHIGELAKARDLLSRSLASREKMFGSSSPLLVAPLDNYAELIAEDGDRAAALAMMERARKLARMMPGTAHPDYHQLSTDEAELMVTSNRLADAHQLFDDTFALERASGSPILPKTLTARAELALAEHKWPEADTFATDAVADFEAQGGAEQPELWKPLLSLAKARLGRGDAAGARPLLARALAVAVKAQVPEHDLAPLRAALAVTGSSPP